jgi:hypothetical protein
VVIAFMDIRRDLIEAIGNTPLTGCGKRLDFEVMT